MNKKLLSVILLLLVTTLCLFGFTACKKDDDEPIDKHVHDYVETVIEPTCTTSGYTLHKCSCGDSYDSDYVNETGIHDYVDGFCRYCGVQQPSNGLIYTVNADNKSCTVTGIGSCTDTEILIPTDIDGYTVSEIGDNAFASCEQITSLIIPDTVETIGASAFYGCMGLNVMHIPSSVTNIGTQIFYKANNLSLVYYDSSYADKDNPFLDLEHITKIVFNCKEIKQYMCNLTYNPQIVIGSGVTKIGVNAFYDCSSIQSITIPDSVTSIGNNAFLYCSSLKGVYITDLSAWCNIEFSGSASNPLYYAHNLYLDNELITDLVIPNAITTIKDYAFYNATCLTSITISDIVTSIGERSFSGCSKLTSLTIGDNVASIGKWAFYDCSTLTSVTIPDSVTSIGSFAFYDCPIETAMIPAFACEYINYTDVYNGLSSHFNRKLKTVVVTSGDTIGANAFYNCSSLTSITIPNSVTSIGSSAFSGCGVLEVYITDIAAWCNIKFCDSGSNPLRNAHNLYLNNTLVTDLVIPNTVTAVKDYVFYRATCLKSITIPDSVTLIGSSAFSGCSSLTSVTIPDSVTSIGYSAFYNCSSLTSVTIPDSVTSIGSSAFNGCSSLKGVYITDIAAWCNIEFNNDYSNPLCWANNLYLNNELVTDLVIPNTITAIKDYVFYRTTCLTSITIPDSVTSIGDSAFWYCSSLTSIIIPDSVTSIGDDAFYGCSGLDGVYITDIAAWCNIEFRDYASNPLYYSHNLYLNNELVTDLVIPNTVTAVKDYVFYRATCLTCITVPDSVTSIGNYAFSGCSSLQSITIPDSVTYIGSHAFYCCYKLTRIDFRGTTEQWNAISKDYFWETYSGEFTVYCTNGNISYYDS